MLVRSPRGSPGYFAKPEETTRRANIPRSTCWTSNRGIPAPDRPSASAAEEDDRSVPPLFWFGSDKHRQSPAASSPDRNSLSTAEGRGEKGGWVENERKEGHISNVLVKITALNLYWLLSWSWVQKDITKFHFQMLWEPQMKCCLPPEDIVNTVV